MKKIFRVALAGNPNCGKTTIFNLLTGARQHVGNYPGVTVESKSGMCKAGDIELEIVDLPGIYSLSSSSPEEKVAANVLLNEDIDLIIDVADASNLQRNLYLTTQLVELNIPIILCFNMIDDAKAKGMEFKTDLLERYFSCRIVPTVGSENIGVDVLRETAAKTLSGELAPAPRRELRYGEPVDAQISALASAIDGLPESSRIPSRYFALKLLEKDPVTEKLPRFAPILPQVAAARELLEKKFRSGSEILIADLRYGIIAGACRESLRITNEKRRQLSDSIDRIMLNKVLGLPIFFLIMLLMFFLTFTCAEPLVGLLEDFFAFLRDLLVRVWPEDCMTYFRDLIAEGVIGGVGGVLVFLPNILVLFLFIAFLETTGYMARAAFVMDGFMHKFGLHGKSFIPMLLGFGCTVPAVMATRTIESRRDRITTILILPLLSCGARLPIYSMIIPAFFPKEFQALAMWGIYLVGIVLALVIAGVLKHTLFSGEDEVFVMELPPYRLPTMRNLLQYMFERLLMYLKKAGTVILFASILLYFLNTLPQHPAPDATESQKLEYSVAGRVGRKLSYVLKPLGFDWKISSALVGAFAGKELFVAQLGILHANENENDLGSTLRKHYTPLQGFCIMIFCLISMPCVATVAVVRKETGSYLLTGAQLIGLTLLAYLVTLAVYQAGLFFHL